MNRKTVSVGAPLVAALLAACSGDGTGRLTLALSSVRPAAPTPSAAVSGAAASPSVVMAGDSTKIALGSDTVILRSVQVVLRKVELKRVEAIACDNVVGNDDCEEFVSAPALVALPLGNVATETVVTVNAPAGMYDELEFEVHKPGLPEDAAFFAANPTFEDVSIRVSGTFSQAGTRSNFVFLSDLNEAQEVLLSPPLTVSEGVATNVTLRLDLATWFLDAAGTALLNPATANKGQPNENAVRDRIRASIDAFHDDDHDGHDDDNELP